MAIGEELSNINFESMIGGPLNAVIRAQAQAAQTSVDFIKAVGFEKDGDDVGNGKPSMVTFQYDKPVEVKQADGSIKIESKAFKLTVPLLTMLPIPFIRVEETTIDFNAKINSVEETTTSTSKDLSTALQGKAGWGPVSAKLSVAFSYKKSTTSGSKVERTYTLAVHVRAVQDELPAGTERLLSILERNITEVPAPPPRRLEGVGPGRMAGAPRAGALAGRRRRRAA